jgi:glycosyltransferase involved in cell wall biosynthesis
MKNGKKSIVMVLYSLYSADPRVYSYVNLLLSEGWQVNVVSLKEKNPPAPKDGVSVYEMGPKYQGDSAISYILSYIRFFTGAFLRVSVLFLSGRCDVVHVHNMPNFIVYAALLPKLFGRKVILDFHDTMPELFEVKFGRGKGDLLFKILVAEERISAFLADAIIATNELHRRMFIRRGIPEDKISIYMNLANPEIFKKIEHPGEKNKFTFIYHGTLAHRLGIDIMLRALKLALMEDGGLRLMIVGSGEYTDTLKRLADELKLGDAVTFSGYVPIAELSGCIGRADAGIVANRLDPATSYMLPVKLLEYTFLKKPCIAARTPTIEHYFDEDTVLFFESGNVEELAQKMLLISRDPSLRERMVYGAHRFNDKFNWDKQKEVYLKLLGGTDRKLGDGKPVINQGI